MNTIEPVRTLGEIRRGGTRSIAVGGNGALDLGRIHPPTSAVLPPPGNFSHRQAEANITDHGNEAAGNAHQATGGVPVARGLVSPAGYGHVALFDFDENSSITSAARTGGISPRPGRSIQSSCSRTDERTKLAPKLTDPMREALRRAGKTEPSPLRRDQQ